MDSDTLESTSAQAQPKVAQRKSSLVNAEPTAEQLEPRAAQAEPTSIQPGTPSARKRLTDILDDQQIVQLLLTLPRDILTIRQLRVLQRLIRHFAENDPESESDDTDSVRSNQSSLRRNPRSAKRRRRRSNEAPQTRPRSHRTRTHLGKRKRAQRSAESEEEVESRRGGRDSDESDDSSTRSRQNQRGPTRPPSRVTNDPPEDPSLSINNPWRRFLKLEAVELDPRYQDHIQAFGVDAGSFLRDDDILQNQVASFNADTVGDAFMACYTYTVALHARRGKDNLRWCFSMLMFYDLVNLIRPNSTGRVGPLMLQEVLHFLGPLIKSPTVDGRQTLQQISNWSTSGYKLNVLCREFGEGCLFLLEPFLTPSFLSGKFTASGKYHEGAMNHLRRLRLTAEGQETGISELGRNIRQHLIRPFKEAMSSAPTPDPTAPGGNRTEDS